MDYLCRQGENGSYTSWVSNTCQCDWIIILISLFATYVAVLLVAYLRWMESNREPLSKNCILQNHNFRAVLAVVLFLTHCAEMADAFLSGGPSHIYIVPAVSITLLILLLILSHLIERTGRPALLFFPGFLWLTNGITRTIRFGILCYIGVGLDRLRSFTAIVSSLLYYSISTSELITASKEIGRNRGGKIGVGTQYDIQSYRHDEVHFLSRATFYWMNSLLKVGYKSPIELEDLGVLPQAHSAKQLHHKLEDIMSRHKGEMTTGNIWKIFLNFMKPDFCIGGCFKFLGDLVGIVGPLGISVMVSFVANEKDGRTDEQHETYPSIIQLWTNGWTMAFIVFFASIAQSTFSQASTHIINVKSIHLRVALQSLIYKRSLSLRTSAKCNLQHLSKQNDIEKKSDDESIYFGFLVNLMSNDATNIMSFFSIGHYIWAIPVKMSAIMFFMYMKLGASAVIGAAGTIVVLMPLQLLIGKKMSKNSSAISELSDERLQHLSILIEKIKLFKLLGWEHYYCSKILKVRRKELELLDKDSVFWAILTFFTHASSLLVSLIIFGVHYFVSDISLTSDAVFSTLALINQLMVPLFIFPVIIPTIAEAMVSCRRISEFCRFPEVNVKREVMKKSDDSADISRNFEMTPMMTSINEEDENRSSQESFDSKVIDKEDCNRALVPKNRGRLREVLNHWKHVSECAGDWLLTIEQGVFSWNPECPQKKLFVNRLRIPAGGIVAIIGKVGSGKTSLLSAILREMPQISGEFTWSRNTSVAYCPQTPWLLNSTIRDNILFGLPFRYRRYDQVVEACALKPDLDILPKKDLTEIGEKGINLSGGQKQRIAIARALYSRADLIILDDPLSSLDLSTALTLFEEAIKQPLRSCKRTVLLATHNLQHLSDCHLVIGMEDGKIKAQGTPDEIRISELLNNRRDLCSTTANSTLKEHRAKERWQLIKSVARIRRSLKLKNPENNPWFVEDNMTTYLPSGKSRKLFDGYSEWNYITHDLPLPTDEFQSKIIDYGSTRRRNSIRKKGIGRASSLQDRHTKTCQVVRQYSSPLTTDNNNQLKTERKSRREFISQYFSGQSRLQLTGRVLDNFNTPVSRVSSIESGVNDLFADLSDENDVETGDTFVSKGVEEREYGKMRNKVYGSYLYACGVKVAIAYFVVTLTWQIVRVNTDFWLSVWIETSATDEVLSSMIIYASLSVGAVILSLISHGLGQYAGSQARKILHDSMLLNIIRCPNKLFESTPAGRIFNRFSADIEVVDKKLATTIQRLMQFLLLCSSSIVINAVITPWFIVTAIPMALLYYIIQMFYSCSSRELQRIDSKSFSLLTSAWGITRSPIFSHFAETLSGVSSIRAFKSEEKFISSFYTKVNLNTNIFLILNSTNRWLGIVLDYLGGVIVLLAMITALVAVRLYPDSVTPSLVGLAMNYTLLVPIYLNWVVKFSVDCEIYLGAVERIKQYTALLTEIYNPSSECPAQSSDGLKSGDIKFENVTLSYGSCIEPALTGINLHIPPGQKIGICGRSGSGKSTLALSLFNMLDIHDGVIKIDGLDITKMPLHELRTSGSIIPQDALLFNGTVRENLDASGVCTEEQLWSAICKAHLKEIIETQYHGNLESEMNAGQSLSGGQKQLFSLARAILQKSSFLIMDEATSNLDKESEQILMSTAQKVFAGKTLLIIAHRLSTVLDCDRIVVLDRGKIVEDGTPSSLINKSQGIFAAMVKSSDEGFLVP